MDLDGVLQVNNVDMTLGGRNDKQLIFFDVHAVDAFLALQCSHRLHRVRSTYVEVLYGLIPGASDQNLFAVECEPAHRLDAQCMRFPRSGGYKIGSRDG